MASKKCSGIQTIVSFYTLGPACNYEFVFLLGGTPLNNIITINSTMSAVAIASLLNTNRAGNVTGIFIVQQVGNDLEVTISDVVLGLSDSVFYHTTVVNLDGCADVSTQPSSLTCSLIPEDKPKGGGGGGLPMQICIPRQYDYKQDPPVLIPCPDYVNYYGRQVYTKISENEKECCYKKGYYKIN